MIVVVLPNELQMMQFLFSQFVDDILAIFRPFVQRGGILIWIICGQGEPLMKSLILIYWLLNHLPSFCLATSEDLWARKHFNSVNSSKMLIRVLKKIHTYIK